MKTGKKRAALIALALIYAGLMVWLMFLRRAPFAERSYNLAPFYTLRQMWTLYGNYERFRRFALVNLLGNVVMFVPLGFFLPAIFRAQRRFLCALFTAALIIAGLEAVQYVTRLGVADVDDLMTNLVGVVLGYVIWRLAHRKDR